MQELVDREAAPAPVILCVHGAGGGGWEWSIWARVFGARGFEVVAPDLQPAAAGIAATRFADYREQVQQWSAGIGAPVVLVGASLGALLALSVVATASPLAIVLVNPLPPRDLAGSIPRRPFAAVVPWRRERSMAGTRRALPDADDAARLFAFRRWRDESGQVLDEALSGVAVPPVKCPVLVLAGDRDADVPASVSHRLAMSLSADFESIAEASHVGPLIGRGAATVAERASDWVLTQLRPSQRPRAALI